MDILKNKEWFCARIRECEDSLYRVALGILRNPEDARDAMQNAYVSAYLSLDTLHDAEKLKPWLFRILINKSKDMLCEKSRYAEIPVESFENECSSLSYDESSCTVDSIWLKSAINQLDYISKTTIVLFYFENMSIKEISIATGATQSTVKVRLMRARQKLKAMLELHMHD